MIINVFLSPSFASDFEEWVNIRWCWEHQVIVCAELRFPDGLFTTQEPRSKITMMSVL
jgi:hypothetical protein